MPTDFERSFEKLTDEQLMAALAGGDPRALDALVDRHGGGVFRFLVGRVGDRWLAEDLTQEVFLAVYKARRRHAPKARFTTWLYRIARNQASKAMRDRKPARSLDAPVDETAGAPALLAVLRNGRQRPEDALETGEASSALWDALSHLEEPLREVAVLRLLSGTEYAQIAEVLDLPVSTVKDRMNRALERLRSALR